MRRRWSLIKTTRVLGWIVLANGQCVSTQAQLNLSGSLEYQGRAEQREVGNDTTTHIGTLRVDGWSYLGAPWIGDLSAGVGLSLGTTREGEASQHNDEVTGLARLRLLPQSKLPFEAFIERRDSTIEGDLIGPSYLQTQYGIKQSFIPSATARVMLNYTHTDQDTQTQELNAPRTHSTSDYGGVSLSKAFERHLLDARSDFTDVRHDTPEERDRTQLHLIRHRYTSGSDFSLDNLGTLVSTSLTEQNGQFDTEQLQWNSNLFWRPATERPSYLSASLLALEVDPNGDSALARTRTLVASGNYAYQFRPELSLRSSASLTQTQSNDQDNLSTLLRAGAVYSPAEIPLSQYVYRYALGGDLGYATDELNGDHQSVNANISHGIGRTREMWSGISSTNLNQQLATNYDTQQDLETILIHSATFDWNRSRGASSAFARLLASDTRRIDGVNFSFDLLNLQASGVVQTSRFSAWSGNMTFQLTKSDSEGSSSPWLSSASAYINYFKDRVFGVRLLRFTSELRALTEDLAVASASPTSLDKRETLSWTNRLDYIVGRTHMSLRASIAEVDSRQYSLIQFLLRRHFGRHPQ